MEKSEPPAVENVPGASDAPLDVFRKEIETLKTEEATKGFSVSLLDVNVSELTEDDMTMWGMYKRNGQNKKNMLKFAFEEYRAQTSTGNSSQKAFVAYLANRLVL